MPNATSRSVFISFKTEEKDHARRLKDALEKRGFDVWWHEDIQCGQDWHGDLDQAVAAAGCVVVLWSTRAMASRWVRHEASQAIVRGVYAPVRIEPIEVDPPFNRVQVADLLGWDGSEKHPGLLHLLARIERLIPPPVPLPKRAALALWRNRLALAGLAVAIGALVTLFETRRSVTQQVEQMSALVRRQEGMALDLERSLHRIDSFEVTALVGVDTQAPALAGYLARFERELDEALKKGNAEALGVLPGSSDPEGPIDVRVRPGSPLWPNERLEGDAYHLLRDVSLSLTFFLDPNPAEAGAMCAPSGRQYPPDLQMYVSTLDLKPTDQELSWNLRERTLEFGLTDRPDSNSWLSNRRIISLPDLRAARMCVSVTMLGVTPGTQWEETVRLRKLRASLQLKYLRLHVSGRDFTLREHSLELAGTDEHGLRHYRVTDLRESEL